VCGCVHVWTDMLLCFSSFSSPLPVPVSADSSVTVIQFCLSVIHVLSSVTGCCRDASNIRRCYSCDRAPKNKAVIVCCFYCKL